MLNTSKQSCRGVDLSVRMLQPLECTWRTSYSRVHRAARPHLTACLFTSRVRVLRRSLSQKATLAKCVHRRTVRSHLRQWRFATAKDARQPVSISNLLCRWWTPASQNITLLRKYSPPISDPPPQIASRRRRSPAKPEHLASLARAAIPAVSQRNRKH